MKKNGFVDDSLVADSSVTGRPHYGSGRRYGRSRPAVVCAYRLPLRPTGISVPLRLRESRLRLVNTK